ncbi:MAG: HD domain-containing protein [Candidatus Caldarchaeum sp.]
MNRITNALLLLKRLRRTGWVEVGVKSPESVADHSYALAVMAFISADKLGLDAEKAVKMALVHDIPESFLGDLTPRMKKKIPRKILETVEKAIFHELFSELPPRQAEQYYNLYVEYLEKSSSEARLVHKLDREELVNEALWIAARQKINLKRFGIRGSGFIRRGGIYGRIG